MLAMTMIELETPYYVIETEPSGEIIFLRRTGAAYQSLAEMEADIDKVIAAFDRLGRDRRGLLIDLRDGPRRNDPAFEDAMGRLRPKLLRGFRHVAVVVRTAVGALQVKRHLRDDGAGAEVFLDWEVALDWLRGQSLRIVESRPKTNRPPRP